MKIFQATKSVSAPGDKLTFPPSTAKAHALDSELPAILELLNHGKCPNGHTSEELDRLHKQACNFFTHDNQLWRRHAQG